MSDILEKAKEVANKVRDCLKGNTVLDIIDLSDTVGRAVGVIFATPSGEINHLTIPGGYFNIGFALTPIIFKKVEDVLFEETRLYGKILKCRVRIMIENVQLVIEYDVSGEREVELGKHCDTCEWSGAIYKENLKEFIKHIVINYCLRNNETVAVAERRYKSAVYRPEQLGDALNGVLIYMGNFSTYKDDSGNIIIVVALKTLQGNNTILNIIVRR